jgi:hypothetical protein
MAYDPTLPGVGEATRAWCVQQITANLGLLNTALARDAATPITTLTAVSVHLGDPDRLPDVSVSPIFFAICGGGRLDGTDMDQINQYYIGPVGYSQSIYTSVVCYIHPDALPASDGLTQEAARQTLLDRVGDWLRGACFNTQAAVAPILTSREYCVAPGFDQLNMAHLTSLERGLTTKSFASSQLLPYLFCRHQALAVGNG